MTKNIIWSPDSDRVVEKILEYLSSLCDSSVAVKFLDIIEDLTSQILINPRQFPLIYKGLNIRKCVITNH